MGGGGSVGGERDGCLGEWVFGGWVFDGWVFGRVGVGGGVFERVGVWKNECLGGWVFGRVGV